VTDPASWALLDSGFRRNDDFEVFSCRSNKAVEARVCEIFCITPEEIYSKSREKTRADAWGLYCYWAVRELGHGLTDLAGRLGMTQPGVGYAVKRGERIAKARGIRLLED
jgi:putative transposase